MKYLFFAWLCLATGLGTLYLLSVEVGTQRAYARNGVAVSQERNNAPVRNLVKGDENVD